MPFFYSKNIFNCLHSRKLRSRYYTCSVAIFRHSSAQERHSCAQCRQCIASYFSHSAAHVSHTSAQALQSNEEYPPPIAISSALDLQTEAHCLSSSIQRAIIFTSSSRRHSVAQCSHSIAHETHASIQACHVSSIIP